MMRGSVFRRHAAKAERTEAPWGARGFRPLTKRDNDVNLQSFGWGTNQIQMTGGLL